MNVEALKTELAYAPKAMAHDPTWIVFLAAHCRLMKHNGIIVTPQEYVAGAEVVAEELAAELDKQAKA